jgi:hypothetical protein
MPFMAGNMIGPLFIPYTPWRSAIYCYLFCVFIKSRNFSHAKRLALRGFRVLMFFTLFTAGAILYAQFNAPHLDSYNQSPLVHGVRVLLGETLIWLLPIGLLWHIQKHEEARKLIRQMAWAAVFYCALGLLQFVVMKTAGYDLFPIVRGANSAASRTIQTVAGANEEAGRINSICGEPRTLSLYCSFWFFLVVASGNAMALGVKKKAGLAALFLLTNILTASRSGLATWAAGLAGLLIAALFARQSRQAKKIFKRAWLLPIAIGLAVLYSGELTAIYDASLLAQRIANPYERSIEMFGIDVPLEFPDLATVTVLSENPWSLLTGYGAGLWQYYVDPFDDPSLRETYRDESGLDSMKQNIAIVARVTNFGLIGIVLLLLLYRKTYRNAIGLEAGSHAPAEAGELPDGRFLFCFWTFQLLIVPAGELYIPIILVASSSALARLSRAEPAANRGGRGELSLSGITP